MRKFWLLYLKYSGVHIVDTNWSNVEMIKIKLSVLLSIFTYKEVYQRSCNIIVSLVCIRFAWSTRPAAPIAHFECLTVV